MARSIPAPLIATQELNLQLTDNPSGIILHGQQLDLPSDSLQYSRSKISIPRRSNRSRERFQKRDGQGGKTLKTENSNSTNPTTTHFAYKIVSKLRERIYSTRLISKQQNVVAQKSTSAVRLKTHTSIATRKRLERNQLANMNKQQKIENNSNEIKDKENLQSAIIEENREARNYQMSSGLINKVIQIKTMGLANDDFRNKTHLKKQLQNRGFILHISDEGRNCRLWDKIKSKLKT